MQQMDPIKKRVKICPIWFFEIKFPRLMNGIFFVELNKPGDKIDQELSKMSKNYQQKPTSVQLN